MSWLCTAKAAIISVAVVAALAAIQLGYAVVQQTTRTSEFTRACNATGGAAYHDGRQFVCLKETK